MEVIEKNQTIKIQYLIQIPKPNQQKIDVTWPNSYDKRIIKTRSILKIISTLQKDISEIYCKKEIAIKNRLTGLFDGYQINFFNTLDEVNKSQFLIKVVFVHETENIESLEKEAIVILPDDLASYNSEILCQSSLTPKTLKKNVLNLISTLHGPQKDLLNELKELVGFEHEHHELMTDITISSGFFTRPILDVLRSLRVSVKVGSLSEDYNEGELCILVNLINHIKIEISKNLGAEKISSAVSYYVCDTSSSLEFVQNRNLYTKASLKNGGDENPDELINAIKVSDRGLVTDNNTDNQYLRQLNDERQLSDSLITLAAASNVAPVIKIPLSNNTIYSQISNLANVDRNGGRKVNAMMKKLYQLLAPQLNGWLEYLDSSPSTPIKFVSNLPLEWGTHQNIPLIIRHEVSRIPVTPGYVSTRLLLDSQVINITTDNFKEILFISSFSDNDPIKNDLRSSLDIIQNLDSSDNNMEKLKKKIDELKRNKLVPSDFEIPSMKKQSLDIKFKWIEVSNQSELVNAINENPCAITVFDLHGSHGENGGLLHLKNETISVFDICEDIKISPIVILSSCDTSPVDKGHNSTAEAFFLAGAKTIISSALPINSSLASTFLARLVERIKTYLPARLNNEGPIRWSTFVSGMIRRTYYYELVSLLHKKLKFDKSKKYELLFKIGILIDPLSLHWEQNVRKEIITQLGITANDLDEFIDTDAQFFECMKYIQLGRPELIVITNNESDL